MKKYYSVLGLAMLLIVFSGCSSFQTKNDQEGQTTTTSKTTTNETTTNEATTETTEASTSEITTEEASDVLFYIEKLKDQTYVSTYGDKQEPSIWYTAAEALGEIGKPAIPYLIANLDTEDSYERGLTLYALLLASQHENMQSITNGEYINVNLTLIYSEQEQYVETAKTWWDKYEAQFE